MPRAWSRSLALALALPTLACSSSGDDDGDGSQIDAGDGPAADANLDGYVELIGADYTIQPGAEPYRCARLTVTEDTYITAIRDLSSSGTHHVVLSVSAVDDPSGPDGAYDCNLNDNELQMLFASGIGSDPFVLPEGVAIKVAAGQQLKINLHLYNGSQAPISGRAGTLVQTITAAEAASYELAEMFFVGAVGFTIPADTASHTETGTCTVDQAGTIINLWPHMHHLGRHMKVSHDATVKLDEPFSFEEQRQWPMTFDVAAGDRLRVECTFDNTGGGPVPWGDSSDTEMCFTGFYRYPAVGTPYICLDGL